MEYVRRHYLEQHTNDIRMHQCDGCLKRFKRKQHLKRHSQTCAIKLSQNTVKEENTTIQYNCCFCNIWFSEEEELFSHWKQCHPLP